MKFLLLFLTFGLIPLSAQSGTTDEEDFFEDVVPIEEQDPEAMPDHEAALLEQDVWSFGGKLTTSVGPSFLWKDLPPAQERPTDAVELQLRGDFFLDARPDRTNRVFLKVRTDYPFKTADQVKIFELFTDFYLTDSIGFRFGKQVAGWGISRFYQPSDVISLEIKDPTDPSQDLEGPLALKGLWSFTDSWSADFFLIAKESYLPEGSLPRAENLGYALRTTFLLPFGAETSLGGFWQKDLSPRLTGSMSMGITGMNIQAFTDQVLSYGSDKHFLDGDRKDEVFYSATVGIMYLNSDLDLTLYAEYYYNGEGSEETDYLSKLLDLFNMEQGLPPEMRTLNQGDLMNRSRHSASVSLSMTDLFLVSRLTAGLVVQWNFNETSGFFQPTLVWGPTDEIRFTAGARLVYGGDFTEFVTRQYGLRTNLYITASLGVKSF